jgi:hypothetical protein
MFHDHKLLLAQLVGQRADIRVLTDLLLEVRKDIRHLEALMAMTKSDLDNALGEITAAIQKLGDDQAATIADLEAKIAAGASLGDLAAEVQALKDGTAKLQAFDATVLAADPGPTPPAPTP